VPHHDVLGQVVRVLRGRQDVTPRERSRILGWAHGFAAAATHRASRHLRAAVPVWAGGVHQA
jgi:hypothetical protein